jgi:hypothetical protein
VNLVQDVVHRIADGAGDSAVDRGGGRLVLERARVGRHATGRNGSTPQRPDEALIPVLTDRFCFDIRQRARDALVGVVHRFVDGTAVFRGQAIFLVPDVERRFLERNGIDVFVFEFDHAIHGWAPLRRSFRMFSLKRPNRRKKRPITPKYWRLRASLDVGRPLSGSRHSSPRLPNHQNVVTQHLVLGSEE